MDYMVSVIGNVLGVLYQNCGASLVIAVLFMSVYMQIKKKGTEAVIRTWVQEFRTNRQFRREFLLVFYGCLVLFRTLFCRTIWGNPLDSVLGIWGLHKADGSIYTENVENLIMFLPLLPLLYRVWEHKTDYRKKRVQEVLLNSLWIGFFCSLCIESCQLFLKIGTFQLTDLFFNSLGGVLGGVLYWGFDRSRKYVVKNVREFGGWDVEPWKGYSEVDGESRKAEKPEVPEKKPAEEILMTEEMAPGEPSVESSTDIDYQAIEAVVRKAGEKLRNAKLSKETIHKKEGLANFCTDFDTEIQRFLIRELSAILPGAVFFGEEDTEGNQGAGASGEYTFYIDPIDGTTNFMFDYHFSCISVGLAHHGKMEAGCVYDPYMDEMYMGIRGKGSTLNGQRLQMENISVTEGIATFGCARYNEDKIDILFQTVQELYMRSLCIRSGGSAALDLCRIASGRNAVYLEMKLNPYDFAAASLIIEEAGGMVGQIDGTSITLDQPCSMLAGTKKAVEETRELLPH